MFGCLYGANLATYPGIPQEEPRSGYGVPYPPRQYGPPLSIPSLQGPIPGSSLGQACRYPYR